MFQIKWKTDSCSKYSFIGEKTVQYNLLEMLKI